METSSLQVTIQIIMTIGVAGLSVPLYDWLKNIQQPQIATWSTFWKRTSAIVLAIIIMSALWALALWQGYMPKPAPDKWLEVWYGIMLPTAIIQQLLQALFPESFKV